MTKDKLPQEYLQWIEYEKAIADNLYEDQKTVIGMGLVPIRSWQITNRSFIIRTAAAAILILAIGTAIFIKKDDIFKPNYTEEQIALSYDQTLRALAVCANSLSKEMNQLKNLNQISEPLDNIKKLGTVIKN